MLGETGLLYLYKFYLWHLKEFDDKIIIIEHDTVSQKKTYFETQIFKKSIE